MATDRSFSRTVKSLAAAMAFLAVVSACGSSQSSTIAAGVSPAASPSPPGSDSRTPAPSPSQPTPGYGHYVTLVNKTGQFTWSIPGDWLARNCEDNGVGYVVADPARLPCGTGEYEDAWLFCISRAGVSPTSAPYRGTLESTTSVVVDGVAGTRFLSSAGSDSGMAPPPGSEVVLYVVVHGGRTYSFEYQHWPSMPDLTEDFDRSVQQMLALSAQK